MSKVDKQLENKKLADSIMKSPEEHADILKTLPWVEDACAVQDGILIKVKDGIINVKE